MDDTFSSGVGDNASMGTEQKSVSKILDSVNTGPIWKFGSM